MKVAVGCEQLDIRTAIVQNSWFHFTGALIERFEPA
jgi:hypothetical protein